MLADIDTTGTHNANFPHQYVRIYIRQIVVSVKQGYIKNKSAVAEWEGPVGRLKGHTALHSLYLNMM